MLYPCLFVYRIIPQRPNSALSEYVEMFQSYVILAQANVKLPIACLSKVPVCTLVWTMQKDQIVFDLFPCWSY